MKKRIQTKAMALLLTIAMLIGMIPVGVISAAALEVTAPSTPVFDSNLSSEAVTYYQGADWNVVKDLSVNASVKDSGTLSYQWYSGKDSGCVSTKLNYGTKSSYTPNVWSVGTTYYQVAVTDSLNGQTATTKSTVAEVIVLDDPVLTATIKTEDGSQIPANGYTYPGDKSVTLKCETTTTVSGGKWKYNWFFEDNSSGNTQYAPGSQQNSTDPTYTIATTTDGKFKISCIAYYDMSGMNGSSNCRAETDNSVPVTVTVSSPSAPIINTQPAEVKYLAGAHDVNPLSIDAKSSDGGTLSYQWYVSSDNQSFSPDDGATSTSYKYASSQKETVFYYYCVVTNTLKSISGNTYIDHVQSNTATVTFESAEDAVSEVGGKMWKGDGTAKSPYLISSADDLNILDKIVNTQGLPFYGYTFKMSNDITLPADWTPIGGLKTGQKYAGQGVNMLPFSGTFDGGNKTLTVPENGLPLFGYVRYATIKNLNIYGTKIAGYGLVNNYDVDYGPTGNYGDYTAGATYPNLPVTVTIDNVTLKKGSNTLEAGFIGGYASGANTIEINNSTVESGVTIGYDATQSNIGSFAGDFNGTMVNCVSSATVQGINYVGGLVGSKGQSMGNCSVIDSVFHGTVTASGNYAGGIMGSGYGSPSAPNTPCVTIQNCYSDGSVSGVDYVGGVLGAEPACKQCWANGIGYIQNNYFSGKVSATAEAHIGGVIGYMRSLDRYNVISNNYYLNTCATAGIGFVDSVDKTTGSYGRSDDPTGADADKLVKAATVQQYTDGTVTSALNSGINSSGTWAQQGSGYPVIGTKKHLISLVVTGYPKACHGGDSLDNMSAFAFYSDGSTKSISPDQLHISGFDSRTKGVNTVTAIYENHEFIFEVQVVSDAEPSGKITVSFRLIGATKSNGDIDLKDGDYKGSECVTWIPTKSYTLDSDSKVYNLFTKALSDAGLKSDGADDNYVKTIYAPQTCGGYELSEFTNGPRSGWMYTIGGVHPNYGLKEQKLKEGDVVIWHYVNDYGYEVGDWTADPTHPALGDGTYYNKWLKASDTAPAAPSSAKVTNFAVLDTAVKNQSVVNGTQLTSLKLPSSLQATVDGKAQTIHGITWCQSPIYTPAAAGTYTFTAVLPHGYTLNGAALPTITITVEAALNSGSSGRSSSHNSTSGTAPAAVPNTVTTSSTATGGSISTVSTQPDAAPVINGDRSNVSVTVPSEIAAVVSTATAEKPAEIKIAAPTASIMEQLNNSAVKTVDMTIKIPAAVANNTNVNAKISINADASVLQAAKDAQKDISLSVTNSDTGKEIYSWTFSGSDLKNSVTSVTNVNLVLNVSPVKNVAVASSVVAGNAADKKASGIVLQFGNSGLLPSAAKVKIYVGDQEGCTPNSKVFLYYLNSTTKALEQMLQSEYTVDANGYVTISIAHCSDYVLLPKAATNPYPVKSDTPFSIGIKSGKTYTFGLTVSGKAAPTFTVGNSKTFTTTVKRAGSKYYVTVKAVGAAGTMTAVYSTLPAQKPVVISYVAVVK